ncbi:invasion associated locus B family protein [Aquicoccus sp. SCR17]|nr:invasion associated locus B family protein [Carideicomes alvinocaridis]
MTRTFSTLPLIALLALASPVVAQDATTDETTTSEEQGAQAEQGSEAQPEAQDDGQLSLGSEVGDEPGSTYVKEEVGDWQLQCIRVQEGEEPCHLYQLLSDEDGNAVAEVSMFRLPEGGQAVAGATVIVPLETLLPAQLTIAVDGSQGKRYPYSFCNRVGCYARIGLTAQDVTSFKRGAKATITVVPFAAPDQKVELAMSLSGFTDGFEKASVIEN